MTHPSINSLYMWIITILVNTSLYMFANAIDAQRTDFSKLRCGLKHNICHIYGSTKFGISCLENGYAIPITDSDKQIILNTHNNIRNKIAGGNSSRHDLKEIFAANMEMLSYSNELEHTAGCWARQCTIGHSRCRAVEEGQLGETVCYVRISNYSVISKATRQLEKCPKLFLYNFPLFTKNIIDNLTLPHESNDERNRETIQLLWATTRYIGCYRVVYPHYAPGHLVILLVCHYFPKGNLMKESVFVRGTPRSKCLTSIPPNEEYPYLCGSIRPLEEDKWEGPSNASKNIRSKLLTLVIVLVFIIM